MEKIPPSKSEISVRLVRCPRCARLLAEPTHVPLYGCGGCGTLLQAKHYKNGSEKIASADYSSGAQNDEFKSNLQPCEELGQQPEVSSSSEEVFSSDQSQAQSQSALSSQGTSETSSSSALARLTLDDPSSTLEQNQIFVEDQFEATDSRSQVTTFTTMSNQEMGVQVLQNESCNARDTDELQLVATLEKKTTNGGLKNSDKIEETRDLHKTQTRKSSAHEGSVSSYEAEYPIFEYSKGEEHYEGRKNTTQRAPPMWHSIEMQPHHTRRGPTAGRRSPFSYMNAPRGFSTSMDGRMFHVHPYYDSSQGVHRRVFSELNCSQDHEATRFQSRRKLPNARRVRSMVGAAPFVTCYKCLELLELPLEFAVLRTRKRSYRVKCSTCLSNLEFVMAQRHLVPYISESKDQDGETEHAQDEGICKTAEDRSGKGGKRSSMSLHKLMGYASPSAMLEDQVECGSIANPK